MWCFVISQWVFITKYSFQKFVILHIFIYQYWHNKTRWIWINSNASINYVLDNSLKLSNTMKYISLLIHGSVNNCFHLIWAICNINFPKKCHDMPKEVFYLRNIEIRTLNLLSIRLSFLFKLWHSQVLVQWRKLPINKKASAFRVST